MPPEPTPTISLPSSGPHLRRDGAILIVSCYELGRQPLAVASTLGFLEREGHRPRAVDLAVESLERLEALATRSRPSLVAISVPMHTALHIGLRAARIVRRAAPGTHLCFFGLYASLNEPHLLACVADSVIGGEIEQPLVLLAHALEAGAPLEQVEGLSLRGRPARPYLGRLSFTPPSRQALPPLERYARLITSGETRLAAAVEASRGCLHLCRHCPIPPVYGGRLFVVPREVVLQDVRRLAAQGVRHLTFADPDFLNGPGHSMAIVRAMHAEFPELTFDVTTKVEHVLKHRAHWEELAASGCLFVVSAVESLSDAVLGHLAKGHGREDVFEALAILRGAGIALRPSLVAFTPWTSLADYIDVLEWVEREELVHHIDPVQFSIRLLLPPGSLLLQLPAMLPHLRGLVPESLSYQWEHPDPRMDRLYRLVSSIVQQAAASGGEDAQQTFTRICEAAWSAAGRRPVMIPSLPAVLLQQRPPRLTEPWFC